MNLFILITIAISLSMDAFTMSLAYGTLNISKKDIILLSSIVGIYHFIMPLIGNLIGSFIFSEIPINPDFIVAIILILIGIEMILDTLREKESLKYFGILKMILFGFTVSIDSFSIGIGLKNITSNLVLSSFLFTIFSFSFTLLGSLIGSKINQLFGVISTLIGGITLILIALFYIL